MAVSQALVQITTWNVGSISPSELGNNTFFNPISNRLADIHVFGFQEAKYDSENAWKKALDSLGKQNKYQFKISQSINSLPFVRRSLIILVYVLSSLDTAFSWQNTVVKTSTTAKGGASISLRSRRTNLMSFTSAHLTADKDGKLCKLEDRIEDYNKIMKKTIYPEGNLSIDDHPLAFFFGDLNFRLANLDARNTVALLEKAKKTYGDKTILEKLFFNDELVQVQLDKRAFQNFQEMRIPEQSGFLPTYKMIEGKLDVYNEKRTPSWTDRILYSENNQRSGLKIQPLYYNRLPNFIMSDHRPVTATFKVDWSSMLS